MQVSEWGSVEPSTLDELQAKARADLEALKPGVLLEWALLQARLHGRSALAQQMLVTLETRSRDLLYRRLLPVVDEGVMAVMVEHRVTSDELTRARTDYEESVACAKGAEHVMSLLERALRLREARKDQQSATRPRAA